MVKYFLYHGRQGQLLLVEHSREGWDFLIQQMVDDNRMGIEEMKQEGFFVDGDFERGFIYIDEGGNIETVEVTELQ